MKKAKLVTLFLLLVYLVTSITAFAYADGLITTDLGVSYSGEAGENATFRVGTSGDVTKVTWYLDDDQILGADGNEVTIKLMSEYNGGYIHCTVKGELNGQTIYSESARCLLTVTGKTDGNKKKSTSNSLPEITKQPTGETINEGEYAIFIARADNADSFVWRIVSPDTSNTVKATQAGMYFSGVQVSGADTEKLVLENVPASMDGWAIECMFTNSNGSVFSNGAVITVNSEKPQATPAPTPTATAKPEATPAPGETVKPDANAEGQASGTEQENKEKPEEHTHTALDIWHNDADYHWHECQCGEIMDKAEHDMEWTVITEPSRKSDGVDMGVCKSCGYQKTRIVSNKADKANTEDKESDPVNIVLIIILAAVLIGVAAIVVVLIKYLIDLKDNKE